MAEVKVSDSEWEIMRVIWIQGDVTAQKVIDALADEMHWKDATVKTLLGRLVKKGMLSTTRDGKCFIYHPLVSEKETVKSATETLFAHICARKMGHALADIIERAVLSKEDVALLEQVLQEKEKTAVDEVACDCIPGQCECNDHCHASKA